MNNVSLVGRPTKDPELRYTAGGVAVCTFVLAVDRDFRTREGVREADFIFVRVWNKQAENVAQYVDKGRLISVTGRISTESQVEKDGNRKYRTEVVAEYISFLSPRKAESREGETEEGEAKAEGGAEKEGGEKAEEGGGFTPLQGEAENPFWGPNAGQPEQQGEGDKAWTLNQ